MLVKKEQANPLLRIKRMLICSAYRSIYGTGWWYFDEGMKRNENPHTI